MDFKLRIPSISTSHKNQVTNSTLDFKYPIQVTNAELQSVGIPNKFLSFNLKEIKDKNAQEVYKDFLKVMKVKFKDISFKNIYWVTGLDRLMLTGYGSLFVKTAKEYGIYAYRQDYTSLVSEFLNEDYTERSAKYICQNYPVLFVDNVGSEHETNNYLEGILKKLIVNRAYDNLITIFATTVLDHSIFKKDGLDSVFKAFSTGVWLDV